MYLHKIVLDTGSNLSLNRVKQVLGDKSYASLTAKTTKRINDLASLALDAYRSKIPIEVLPGGGALRNQNLRKVDATPQSGIAYIEITGTHTSVRSGHREAADILADALNIGFTTTGKLYMRSRMSEAVAPYSAVTGATKSWIPKARQAFATARRAI